MTPAPISSISESATSATISAPARAECPRRPRRCGRLPSACRSDRSGPARSAGSAPARSPVEDRRGRARRAARARRSTRRRRAVLVRRAATRPAPMARVREQQAGGAAGDGEHERFDQQVLEDAAGGRRRARRGSRSPSGVPSPARGSGCRRWRTRSAARARRRRAASGATSACRRRSARWSGIDGAAPAGVLGGIRAARAASR